VEICRPAEPDGALVGGNGKGDEETSDAISDVVTASAEASRSSKRPPAHP